jgi:SulP family sulfate permease
VIDISDVPFIDLTAIFTLKDLIGKLKSQNIEVIIIAKEKDKLQLLRLNKHKVFDNIKFYDNIKQIKKDE